MGVSFSSEIASKTATASEICERQSRKETAINSRKKNFCSQSSEIAQRTPPPEGMQDISRTERSVNEKFGSSDKSTAAGSSVKVGLLSFILLIVYYYSIVYSFNLTIIMGAYLFLCNATHTSYISYCNTDNGDHAYTICVVKVKNTYNWLRP